MVQALFLKIKSSKEGEERGGCGQPIRQLPKMYTRKPIKKTNSTHMCMSVTPTISYLFTRLAGYSVNCGD